MRGFSSSSAVFLAAGDILSISLRNLFRVAEYLPSTIYKYSWSKVSLKMYENPYNYPQFLSVHAYNNVIPILKI